MLIEILHPAHVHFFKSAIKQWIDNPGDEVLVLSRKKDVANELLEAYDIPYLSISAIGSSKASLLTEMITRDWRMLREARKFRPDVLIGIMGVTIVQVAKIIGKPALVFYDTENATITNRFVYPLAHAVCTPDCYAAEVNGRHVTYPSYHELAYLHPNRFTPDPDVVLRAGIDPSSPYFILRFVSWQASHDVGERGLSLPLKMRLVDLLEARGRVLISSEGPLPPELEQYRFRAPPHEMHHFLAHAHLLIGESATMASEAAVLGVPALYIADTGRGYTDELERRYGLVSNITLAEAEGALEKVRVMLESPDLRAQSMERRASMLRDKIDATTWLMDYVRRTSDAAR